MNSVVHCKKEKYDVYIGRNKNKFHFGNPFTHKTNTLASTILPTREESIIAYEEWLLGKNYHNIEQERRTWIVNNLHKLQGKILGCWCKPKACHGDVLIKLLNKKGGKYV